MEKTKDKHPIVLLLAMTSYAGMGPYVATIINYFKEDESIRYFVIEREDKYYTRNIHPSIKGKIIEEKSPSKLTTLKRMLIPSADSYAEKILQYCINENISFVHSLTSLSDIRLTCKLVKNYSLLYTVHDLHPHEAKKVFYKEWRQNVYYKRIFKAIEKVDYLFTNSKSQLNEQKILYPDKRSFFAPFPSLITDEIASGKDTPYELIGIQNYILFFGRIEEYKGINILVKAFLQANIKDTKLVIAGRGDAKITKNSNIIFINRYIKDSEIANLFLNASCVVYPYISATQSGVLSLASYFQIPAIVSDVSFFKEVLGNDYLCMFENKNINSLTSIILKYYSQGFDISMIKKQLSQIYDNNYSKTSQKDIIKNIYNLIINRKSTL